jgi:uncharacterized protein
LIILGFVLAIVMGLILGLIGSGGSMLTVPILVYLFGIKPSIATGYSLLVVGSTAAVGVCSYWRQGLIRVRDTFIFVLPSTVMILITRRFILPAIPDVMLHVGDVELTRAVFIMTLFACLMLFAGSVMLRPVHLEKKVRSSSSWPYFIYLMLGSALVGLLAGLVGAGGGFLMIPVLVTWFRLSVKEAIGTSLAVIMVNSLVGFQGDVLTGIAIDWGILGPFLGLAILGMLLGIYVNHRVDGQKLKTMFGCFMLALGSLILTTELFSVLR